MSELGQAFVDAQKELKSIRKETPSIIQQLQNGFQSKDEKRHVRNMKSSVVNQLVDMIDHMDPTQLRDAVFIDVRGYRGGYQEEKSLSPDMKGFFQDRLIRVRIV